MADILGYSVQDGVAVLRLDDGKANALSHAMLEAINGAFDKAEKEATAVVLTGRDGRFSAGFDLKTMMTGVEAATQLVAAGAEMYLRIYESPLPVVAACSGHALAGGALLLLVADTRIGAEGNFKIGLNEVAISMTLPILAQELARDRIATRHLTEATVQARIYTPDGATEAGYLDRLESADNLMDVCLAEAKRLGQLPRTAYANTKKRLRARTIQHIRDTLRDDMLALAPT